jgi:ribosome maturation factor RimP
MGQVSAADTQGKVRAIAERVAASRGLEIFDVLFRREPRGWVLRIYLDKPGAPVRSGRAGGGVAGESVTIEDCQGVSNEVSAILDVEDVVGVKFVLEVSSPGLDRPLRRLDDYRRFAGCLAKLVLSRAVDGQMHLRGRLQGVENDEVLVVDDRGRPRRVPFAVIVRAQLEVEF